MDEKLYTTEELMNLMGLNDMVNFRTLYRTPAIKAGYISMLYPDKPNHRGQKYFLTQIGISELKKTVTK